MRNSSFPNIFSSHPLKIISLVFISLVFSSLSIQAKDIKARMGNVDISAHLVLAEGKTLLDKTVLLTHGTLAHNKMEFIVSMQKLLAERGLNSLAINLSYGISDRKGMYDCAKPHFHKHTDALDEIGFWLDWLKKEKANDIILMGHSRGGNQTAWFAAERHDHVISKVVLIAPATWSEEKSINGYKKRYEKDFAPLLASARNMAKKDANKLLPGKHGFVYCKDAEVSAKSFISYYSADKRRHTPSLLNKIKVPVLVVAGSDDKVVADLIGEMKKKADGKKVHFAEIADADHFFIDFAGEDAADSIAEFLE